MQVSFNGLYLLTGKSENTKIDGDPINETDNITLKEFLKDTKLYRDEKGYSYYNKSTSDYYLAVSKECEGDFEDAVCDYGLDCYKVGDEVAPNFERASEEYNKLQLMRVGWRFPQKIIGTHKEIYQNQNNNIIKNPMGKIDTII